MTITGAKNDPALRPTASTPARGRGRTLALWVLQAILIFMFAVGGLMKLGGAHSMVHMFGQIGAGQWFRYLIGSLELAGAVGMLIPALSGLAALALSALMAGASITNAFIIHTSPLVPLVFLVISVLVAWGRWPQTRALAARAIR
jgi:putative oxidoreductase